MVCGWPGACWTLSFTEILRPHRGPPGIPGRHHAPDRFNYRATEYLAEHGWTEFFHWFDYKVWYPLGRPVGTTIYPGMQITSVVIWNTLKWMGGAWKMSLNDVCCFVPAWFGSSATLFLGLLAGECSMSSTATVVASGIMAVIPAHIMRSVGGGYDNESIALTAMCMTFYFWIRSLRAPYSTFFAVLAGMAYVYMVRASFTFSPPLPRGPRASRAVLFSDQLSVSSSFLAPLPLAQVAAWGGYVFVINMVGAHAGILVLLGYFNQTTYIGFTLFYLIGTFGATRVPVVGWVPLKSLEQLGSCAVFLGYQAIQLCEMIAHRKGITKPLEKWKLRVQVPFSSLPVCLPAFCFCLLPATCPLPPSKHSPRPRILTAPGAPPYRSSWPADAQDSLSSPCSTPRVTSGRWVRESVGSSSSTRGPVTRSWTVWRSTSLRTSRLTAPTSTMPTSSRP